MIRILTIALLLSALNARADEPTRVEGPAHANAPARGDAPEPWHYAGENHGVRFFLKIANECRESGANVAVKLESSLDYAVTVSFRINDPDWSRTFQRDLRPGEKDSGLRFTPGEGTACHPFVDEIFVTPKGRTQVSKSEEETGE